MPVVPGTRLGPYEIQALLGAGGMGEVYKARDTRLDRSVALKILPAHLSSDPDLRERLDREARAVAALNHPHICTLFDVGHHDGTDFLVLEYLQGETLADRLKKGAVPLDEALTISVHVTDALDRAHRAGITHRDLKPGNIMLTKAGAKLLDFGLAKSTPAAAASGLSMLPTTPPNLTVQGAILGTFQYMAPEQLEGLDADPRTDIFAFGVVLYEMITARKAFEGRTQASLIAAILERQPTSLPETLTVPPALEWILEKCLKKDPDARWQSARDLSDQLRWVSRGSATPSAVAVAPPRRRSRGSTMALATIGAVVVIAAAGVAGTFWRRSNAVVGELIRFSLMPPPGAPFARGSGAAPWPTLSPDGRRLVFGAVDRAGVRTLWIRALDSLAAQPLAGTQDATQPFWSPDGRSIAFFAQGKLRRMEVAGGAPQTIAETTLERRGTWNRDGVILFAARTGGIYRVPSAGGQPLPVTTLDQSRQEIEHLYPSFLPDGRRFLYLSRNVKPEQTGIYVGTLDAAPPRRLLNANSEARYAPPGYLLFARDFTLMAQPIDARSLAASGDPVAVGEQIGYTPFSGIASFSVSDNGVLAYGIGAGTGPTSQLLWIDRQGKVLETVGPPGSYQGLDIASDARRVATQGEEGQGSGNDIWLTDLARGTSSRFTFEASQNNSSPIWSPDGTRIVFASLRSGKYRLYQKASDGTAGSEALLLESPHPLAPTSWSADGQSIVYVVNDPKTRFDLWLLPLSGDRKPVPLANSRFVEAYGQVSPDGKWLAYTSDETGQSEVYVRPFMAGPGKWQVSTTGGTWPRWGSNGRELFYQDRPDGGKLMGVEIKTKGSLFEPGAPKELFQTDAVNPPASWPYHHFGVSPDGQRFLLSRSTPAATGDSAVLPIVIVINWTAGLNK